MEYQDINFSEKHINAEISESPVKNPLHREQEEKVQREALAGRIMESSRNELLVKLRYLDLAFGELPIGPGGISPAGTDGTKFLYNPSGIIKRFIKSRAYINHLYLHTVFHLVLCHPFDRKDRDKGLWDLSCDIVSESLIDGLNLKCVHLASSFRQGIYARLKSKLPVLTAEGVYLLLDQMELSPGELALWSSHFSFDSHALWENGNRPGAGNSARKRWEDINESMQTGLTMFSHEASKGEGDLLEKLSAKRKSRYDYREFLKKFMVLREEVQTDPESFDYIFYHYGMSLYGNMPLIEPLETREVKGIEDLVIAIDTSMSTSGDLVRGFFDETFSILEEEGSFFKRMRVHIIQCDEDIRSDKLIRNHDELTAYMAHFTLKGGGGTDFRPVFTYVQEKIADKSFGRLKGLLYFTDGYGVFPLKMPRFDTAFIFFRDNYKDVDVPPWAMKLVLDRTDFAYFKDRIKV